jgi:CTP:molybdopterin cytidylyltransferase MocA
MIGAIILAAGESKRMGKSKALLELPDGITLLTTQVNLLSAFLIPPLCKGRLGGVDNENLGIYPPSPSLTKGGNKVLVVLGHVAENIINAHPELHVSWCINEKWKKGQFVSLQAGLKIILNPPIPPLLKGGVKPRWGLAPLRGERGFVLTAIVVLPIDVVGVNAKTISAIINAASENPEAAAIVPGYNGHKGHPVLLSRSFAEHILKLDPSALDARLDKQIEKSESIIKLPINDPQIVANINTAKEWEEWLKTKIPPL